MPSGDDYMRIKTVPLAPHLVMRATMARLGPHRPRAPRPANPVRPSGLLWRCERVRAHSSFLTVGGLQRHHSAQRLSGGPGTRRTC